MIIIRSPHTLVGRSAAGQPPLTATATAHRSGRNASTTSWLRHSRMSAASNMPAFFPQRHGAALSMILPGCELPTSLLLRGADHQLAELERGLLVREVTLPPGSLFRRHLSRGGGLRGEHTVRLRLTSGWRTAALRVFDVG